MLSANRTQPQDGEAQLYETFAPALLRIVARQIRTTPENVEDACHFAWAQYLAHAQHVQREKARAWLGTTAIRHATKLHCQQQRTSSLEHAIEQGQEPAAKNDTQRDAEHHEQLALLGQLPARQQRVVHLQAAGLTYSEIAAATGDSQGTVERQLLRAHRRLRQLRHQAPAPAPSRPTPTLDRGRTPNLRTLQGP